jgi:hypothetical protein
MIATDPPERTVEPRRIKTKDFHSRSSTPPKKSTTRLVASKISEKCRGDPFREIAPDTSPERNLYFVLDVLYI